MKVLKQPRAKHRKSGLFFWLMMMFLSDQQAFSKSHDGKTSFPEINTSSLIKKNRAAAAKNQQASTPIPEPENAAVSLPQASPISEAPPLAKPVSLMQDQDLSNINQKDSDELHYEDPTDPNFKDSDELHPKVSAESNAKDSENVHPETSTHAISQDATDLKPEDSTYVNSEDVADSTSKNPADSTFKDYTRSARLDTFSEGKNSTFSVLGSIGGGVSYTFSCFPHCGDVYGTILAQFLLQCKRLGLCTKYNIGLFRSELSLSFSNDPRGQADPSIVGSLPDYHLPYGSLSLRTVEFQFTPRVYASFGNFSFSRAHYYLNEALNAQGTVGLMSTRFGTFQKKFVQGGCSFGMAGPGFKSVSYSTGAIPFYGLYALGIEQDCQLAIGNAHLQTMFSYSLQSTLSVGQTGAGNSREPGVFGALLSENQLTLGAGLFIAAPPSFQNKGIVGFSINAPFTIYYHLNRGCSQELDQLNPTCGNNFSRLEVRVPIMLNLLWGTPGTKKHSDSETPSSARVHFPLLSEQLSPSRFTPSQGL